MNYGLLAVTRQSRSKTVPLSPFLNPPKPLARSRWHASVLRTACVFVKIQQILKFHERVISALILVASFARPKISSQFLRVSESLKFVKQKIIFKKLDRGLSRNPL